MNRPVDLFSPLQLGGLTLPNRIAVSPMCQYSGIDGFATDWHLVHLGSRAVGGAGLVIVEATAVSPEGRITPGDLGLWKDEQIPKLQQIVDFLHSQGARAGIQLAHAGRKASMAIPWEPERVLSREEGGWTNILAPSAIRFADHYGAPLELSVAEIVDLKAKFVAAAQRSLEAGFDVLEIHAAHGYLFHEFLSPISNKRSDQYGGDFGNRVRFLLEVVHDLRAVVPQNLALLVRISATDWVEDGWTVDDSVELAKLLKQAGVDLVDVSSGGNVSSAKIPVGPGYQVPLAAAIRDRAQIATAAVGLISDPEFANEIVRNGQADLVLLARELLRDPYWPLHAARKLDHAQDISWPPQYLRAAGKEARMRHAVETEVQPVSALG